jgi:hypothetical protein
MRARICTSVNNLGVDHDLELSRTSTRLFFLATMNLCYAMYNLFLQDLINVVLPICNFFIILFAFAALETELEEKQRNKMEVIVVEHI